MLQRKMYSFNLIFLGIIFANIGLLKCKQDQTGINSTKPIVVYEFSRSKFQIADIFGNIVALDSTLYLLPGRYCGETILQKIDNTDTFSYYLHYYGTIRSWLEKPESIKLALVDISGFIDHRKSIQPVERTMKTEKRESLIHFFDETLIRKVDSTIDASNSYKISKIHSSISSSHWIICKYTVHNECDTIILENK